jgi:ornithine cyclodeaminase
MSLFVREEDVKQLLSMPMAPRRSSLQRALVRLACDAQQRHACRRRRPFPAGALPQFDVIGHKAYTSNRSGVRFLVQFFVRRAATDAGWRAGRAGGGRVWCRLAGGGAYRSARDGVPLLRVKVSRATPSAWRPLQKMSERLALEVIPATSPEEVVRGSDIVSTVTTSATPLFAAEWLSPGTHINAAGSHSLIRRELGEDVLKRCSPIVVDSVETALHESGDLLPLLKRPLARCQLIDWRRDHGRCRALNEEITSLNRGAWLPGSCTGRRLETLARERGLGVELPYGG